MAQVAINGTSLDNTFTLDSLGLGVTAQFNGFDASDTFNIGNGDLDSTIFGTVNLNGGNGVDELFFNDTTDGSGVDTVTITATSLNKPNFTAPINYSLMETKQLDASPHADFISITSGSDWTINGNAGGDTIEVVGILFGDRVTIDGGLGLDTIRVNSDALGVAAVQFDVSQDLSSLEISTGGSVFVTPGAGNVLIDTTVTLINGVLDLGNNRLIDRASAIVGYYNDRLRNGYNAGAWNGLGSPAIVAPFAGTTLARDGLGVAIASAVGATTFGGVGVSGDDILVGFTLDGDANLDRTVNFNDLVALAANYNTSGKLWYQGNFNYGVTGMVDFNDLVPLAVNYNSTLLQTLNPRQFDRTKSVGEQIELF